MVSNTPIATASSVGEFQGAQRIPFIREEVDGEDTANLHQSVPPFAGYPLCLACPSVPRFGVPGNWEFSYDTSLTALVIAYFYGNWGATSMNRL